MAAIKVNQKAVKLNDAINLGFARLRELGAPEKAIVFTDSTKTQDYIVDSLRAAGRGEGIVIFNGTNDSAESTAIYREWLERNKGSDIVTGITSADRRKALVDYFRDHGSIMVATEAAAEGINLQFCSMVVNYDLPWNPQRVEQRIGRAHRYGQKFNVIVVNFFNKGNVAEHRILELLTDKFKLFTSVFGASDQVLGQIEDGLDFEKQISRILNSCRTEAEISKAFDELAAEFKDEIELEMSQAKARVFDNLDPNVQDRLKSYDEQSGDVLNKFERLLLAVTRRELAQFASFEGDGRNFVLNSAPSDGIPVGAYYFKSQPAPHAHQYRYASDLARFVIDQSKEAPTPSSELTFSLSNSERVSAAARGLEGKSGQMAVKLVTFSMKANESDISESYLVTATITDDGEVLDNDYAVDILDLACVQATTVPEPASKSQFDEVFADRKKGLQLEVRSRNTKYFEQQEQVLYQAQQDRTAEHEAEVKEYRRKEKDARKASNQTDDPTERLGLRREAKKWDEKADDAHEAYREAKREFREEADVFLELIAEALKGTQVEEDLFTVRWAVEA
jgi:superfamily II DNA/RNA helicase